MASGTVINLHMKIIVPGLHLRKCRTHTGRPNTSRKQENIFALWDALMKVVKFWLTLAKTFPRYSPMIISEMTENVQEMLLKHVEVV